MKKPLLIRPAVFVKLRNLQPSARAECWDALLRLTENFGQPHLHSGLSIRKLGRTIFECRGTQDLRILFLNLEDCLEIVLIGNHDDVQRELKKRR